MPLKSFMLIYDCTMEVSNKLKITRLALHIGNGVEDERIEMYAKWNEILNLN